MKPVLRIAVFRRLLGAYALNELTWSFGTIALASLVYRRTGSGWGAAAFFVVSQALPAALAPAVVSRVIGRPPRHTLPVIYAVEGLLFAALAKLTGSFSLVPVFAILLVNGALATSARGIARSAAVEVLKPRDLLHEGNAIINLAFSACFMAGPAVAGVVVASGGTVPALLVNCGLFLLIAIVLATASGLPPANVEEAETGDSTLSRLSAAVRYAWGETVVRRLLLLNGAGMAIFTISVPVEVVFAEHTLHAGPGGYGAMLAGWGAGAVVGSTIYARWRRTPRPVLIACSCASFAISFAITGAAPNIVVAVAGATFGGAGNGVAIQALKTMLQEHTPRRWMTLTTILNESISEFAPGLGFLLGGGITALAGARVAFELAAVGSAVMAVAAWTLLRRFQMPLMPDPITPPVESEIAEAVRTSVPTGVTR